MIRRLVAILAFPLTALAQVPADTGWDPTQPRGRTRTIDFTTDEGTWTSVDLSRDGSFVVFDLLSHIYRMPSAGGAATSLTQNSGVATNYRPRLSPDGKSIAFISDRKGQRNLWVMDADGNNPRPVALDPKSTFAFPQWTSDNQYIVVVKMTGFGTRTLMMNHNDGGAGCRS